MKSYFFAYLFYERSERMKNYQKNLQVLAKKYWGYGIALVIIIGIVVFQMGSKKPNLQNQELISETSASHVSNAQTPSNTSNSAT